MSGAEGFPQEHRCWTAKAQTGSRPSESVTARFSFLDSSCWTGLDLLSRHCAAFFILFHVFASLKDFSLESWAGIGVGVGVGWLCILLFRRGGVFGSGSCGIWLWVYVWVGSRAKWWMRGVDVGRCVKRLVNSRPCARATWPFSV